MFFDQVYNQGVSRFPGRGVLCAPSQGSSTIFYPWWPLYVAVFQHRLEFDSDKIALTLQLFCLCTPDFANLVCGPLTMLDNVEHFFDDLVEIQKVFDELQ